MNTPVLQGDSGEAPLRRADEVLDPHDLGGARYTRHSFARALLRRAATHRWLVSRELFDVDPDGRGSAVYRVDAEGRTWRFVAFSRKLADCQRTDRVIAESWDVTGALIEGDLDEDRMSALAREVPKQEAGRVDQDTVILTRANRSERFFDYVVERLAAGEQPDPQVVGSSPYVLRSTAFYSNGKFGLSDFERFELGHPFAVPYRAHMLAAWLLRELSYDLVEHCAAVRSADAVRLSGAWRRYLGLGNATGLGMVPFVVNHPAILDSWAKLRELPLASVLATPVRPGDADVARARELTQRAHDYLSAQDDLTTAPYLRGPVLAEQLSPFVGWLDEFARAGTVDGDPVTHLWRVLHDRARAYGPDCRGLVASILTELADPRLDDEIEAGLRVDETLPLRSRMTCGELSALLAESYRWVDDFDFTEPVQRQCFWFSSENNEEPRRADSGVAPGESVAHRVDIARTVTALRDDLRTVEPQRSVGEFLLERPWHRQATARAQTVSALTYGEVRDNLVAADFLPLNVQRFQLAVYGMENYCPQSTDWLRVTLFSGAPRAAELAEHTVDDDWIFPLRPERTDRVASA